MPTRVVLRPPEPPKATPTSTPLAANNELTHRNRGVHFANEVPETQDNVNAEEKLSRHDIIASRQLESYVICFAASVTCLLSYLAYHDSKNVHFHTYNIAHSIDWKARGSFYAGIAGTSATGLIILVHFDKFICPGLWQWIFHAGSKAELVIISLLFIFYCCAAYVCTSPYSLGEIVPNIFFASWIAVGASVRLGMHWMRSAGMVAIGDRILHHKRKTTKYWAGLVITNAMAFSTALEVYLRRKEGRPYFGVDTDEDVQWGIILPVTAGGSLLSMLGLVGSSLNPRNFSLNIICCTLNLSWDRIEAVFFFLVLGVYSAGVIRYNKDEAFITRPSNAYFGLWGSLLLVVIAISTLIKENNFVVLSYSNENGLQIFSTTS